MSARNDSDFPLVSVAVVTYNQAEFLGDCIRSILAQEYPNIEIVVADDRSTDGTQALLADYEKAYPGRFIVRVASSNQGITRNQNAALFSCNGTYISWMAGDDLMLPNKIAEQVRFLEDHPDYAICYHDLDIFDSETGRSLGTYNTMNKPRTGDVRIAIRYGAFNGAVSNMVRASCSPPSGFNERILLASDWLYWVECLWSGGKIGYIDKVLARHRRHEKNITNNALTDPSMMMIEDHLFSCDVILARGPGFYADVQARRAEILRWCRWRDNGKLFEDYLKASIHCSFSWKALAGLWLSRVFNIRR